MLREALQGQVLESSDLRVAALATTDLSGRTVVDVVPRGKHILIRLSEAPNADDLKAGAEALTLHSHLMMDGTWRVFERAGTPRDGAERGSGARAASSARSRSRSSRSTRPSNDRISLYIRLSCEDNAEGPALSSDRG